MATVLALSGSPSRPSRTDAVVAHVVGEVAADGHAVDILSIRDLPPAALLAGDAQDPAVAEAVDVLTSSDALIIATPVYKAAYTGVLKTFLDLLPQFVLAGKVVLPLATGGSPAHVLVVDYALRPVLTSLGADHVTQGWFVLASQVEADQGGYVLGAAGRATLAPVIDGFRRSLARLPVPAT